MDDNARTDVNIDDAADPADGAVTIDGDASTMHDDSRSEDSALDNGAVVDVEAVIAERDSMREIAQRLQADFENYRKRVATQTADEVDRATGRVAESLLPVLDACEAAYVAHPQEVEPLFNLLLGELKKQGLEVMDLTGKPFDPELAEAVMHEPGDEGTGTVVVDVMRTGYLWKGKVLRAAMVKVRG